MTDNASSMHDGFLSSLLTEEERAAAANRRRTVNEGDIFDGNLEPLTKPLWPESKSVLLEALEHTRGDRQQAYAHPFKNFADVSVLWEEYLMQRSVITQPGQTAKNIPLNAEDVAYMMTLLKLVRETNEHRRDNVVDDAGYIDCADRIHEVMIRLGYPNGVTDLRQMTREQYRALVWRVKGMETTDLIFQGV